MWGCFIHNKVNTSLKKPEFDCKDIGDAYDCGCADEGADPGTPGTARTGI
jgi:FAD-linked sulfhydryl oxidase